MTTNDDRDEIIEERATHNLDEFVEKGPGLRRTTRHWIVARDDAEGYVLLGGLGGLGVGQMWAPAMDYHRDDPTYAEAPQQSCLGGFGHSSMMAIGNRVRALTVDAATRYRAARDEAQAQAEAEWRAGELNP